MRTIWVNEAHAKRTRARLAELDSRREVETPLPSSLARLAESTKASSRSANIAAL